jgi:carbon storage regulator CsrA
MLVITRKEGEGFWIGPDIRVVVQSVRGGSRASLAIHAPLSLIIQRDDRVAKEKPEALDAETAVAETAFGKGGSNL